MASSLFALLDDIAVLTKVAAKKTAGVLGDDLALNAKQVTGVDANRELPVVWAVAKGSLANKAILVPAALAISAVAPWAVTSLLVVGGAFLCFEGVEKIAHALHRDPEQERANEALHAAAADPAIDLVALERDKIKGAIRTDFILSAEIIVITLGTVATQPFGKQLGVLVAVSLLMTVGVYGLVAAIVKIDDAGLLLTRRKGRTAQWLGHLLLASAPWLMRALSIAGTAAMFLVGGGILTHAIPWLHHVAEAFAGVAGGFVGGLLGALFDAAIGIGLGVVVFLLLQLGRRVRRPRPAAA